MTAPKCAETTLAGVASERTERDTSSIARSYAHYGLAPIRIAQRDKRPIDDGWQRGAIDAAAVDAWLDQGGNVGLRMGEQPNGARLIALDEDEPGALAAGEAQWGALPETMTSRSGSGGQHRIFAWPADKPFPKNKVRAGGLAFDVRSQGGQIVVAPSIHPSGGHYEWIDDRDPAPLPDAWIDALLTPSTPRAKSAAVPPSVTPDARAKQLIGVLAPLWAPAGEPMGRHPLVRAIGGYLARRGWPDEQIAAVVVALPSNTPAARVAQALESAAHARAGGDAPGWGELSARFPESIAAIEAIARDPREPAGFAGIWSEWWARRLARRANVAANDGSGAEGLHPTAMGERHTTGRDPEVDHVIDHLSGPEVGVFQRSGKLVIVTHDAVDDGEIIRPAGAPTIRELVPARLKEIIRTTAGPRVATLAPEVLARGEWHAIRPLDAITSYPVMRRDGSLLLESGYDAPTRTLATIDVGVSVPEVPTQEDARAAVAMLEGLVCDFPFASDAARAAWLAMLLTVVARPAIDGPTPLGLFEATMRGSGKSMLADLVAIVTTGAPAPRRVAPKTREEWDKVLFSILLAGDPVVLFDNVTNMLASDALDAVLTGTHYAQRVLGVSEDRRVAVRTVFLVSANNARLSTDLVRRSLGCRLEPQCEHPEARTGFRYENLLGHAREHRAAYLGAALSILWAYVLAGRPRVQAQPMGSYEAWCRVVRDALVWAGGADPAATQDALREGSDVERDELRDLLAAWDETLGDRPLTTKELLDAARGANVAGSAVERFRAAGSSPLLDAIRAIMPAGVEPSPHAVGNRLRMMRGQIVGGLALVEGPRARGDRATYRVVRR